jgi:hypothetical protein
MISRSAPSSLRPGAYDAKRYIERPVEERLALEQLNRDGIVALVGPVGSGKTWLARRLVDLLLEGMGGPVRLAPVSLSLSENDLAGSAEGFYQNICRQIASSVGIYDLDVERQLLARRGNTALSQLNRMIGSYILPRVKGELVVAFGQVDDFLSTRFRDDLFVPLRIWFYSGERRWPNLYVILQIESLRSFTGPDVELYQHEFLPKGVPLRAFDVAQAGQLFEQHWLNMDSHELREILHYVGGRPDLLRMAAVACAEQRIRPESIAKEHVLEKGVFAEHFADLMKKLKHPKRPDLTRAVAAVLRSSSVNVPESHFVFLHRMGLIAWDDPSRRPRVAAPIYERFLEKLWMSR